MVAFGKWDTHCLGKFHTRKRILLSGKKTTKNDVNLIFPERSQNQILSVSGKDNCIKKTIDFPKMSFIITGMKYNDIIIKIIVTGWANLFVASCLKIENKILSNLLTFII